MTSITPSNFQPRMGNLQTLVAYGGNTATGVTDADSYQLKLLANLTPDDWAVVSAAYGSPRGPDKDGNVEEGQPSIAWEIAWNRQDAVLHGPLTSGFLQAKLVPGQAPDYVDQLTKAVDFLKGREQASRDVWAQDPILRSVDVSA
jgi:hypothetical protein